MIVVDKKIVIQNKKWDDEVRKKGFSASQNEVTEIFRMEYLSYPPMEKISLFEEFEPVKGLLAVTSTSNAAEVCPEELGTWDPCIFSSAVVCHCQTSFGR